MVRLNLFLAASGILLLNGCSHLPYSMDPYRYKFDSPQSSVVCLKISSENSVAMAYEVRKALEEKGLRVQEVNSEEEASRCQNCVRFDFEFGGWMKSNLKKATLELRHKENGQAGTVRVSSIQADQKGFMTTNSEDIGTTIRLLVDRLFPQPIPWISE